MEARVMREAAMSPAIISLLNSMGFDAYAEVGVWSPIDHVGVKWETSDIIAIEMKTTCSAKVFQQARLNQLVTHRSYIAVPKMPRTSSVEQARRQGIGLIVDGAIVLEAVNDTRINVIYADRILEKCRKAVKNEVGGLPTLKGDGPAIKCAARVYAYRQSHPQASWADVFTNVPNHYSTVASMRGSFFLRRALTSLETQPQRAEAGESK